MGTLEFITKEDLEQFKLELFAILSCKNCSYQLPNYSINGSDASYDDS